jgi:hypothetical protein
LLRLSLRPRPYQRLWHGVGVSDHVVVRQRTAREMPAAPRRSSFPMTSWNAINTGALRVYPAISIGASAQGSSPQTPDDKQSASYTVSPILSGRRRQVGHRPVATVATTSWATRLRLHLRFPLVDWGNPSDRLGHRHRSPGPTMAAVGALRPPRQGTSGATPAVLRDPRLRVPPGGARRYQDLTERQGTFNSVSSSVAANPRDCRPRLASPSAGRSPRQAPGHGFRQFARALSRRGGRGRR